MSIFEKLFHTNKENTSDKEDKNMKIAVICANGKAGKLIVKEALDRKLDVTRRRPARSSPKTCLI